MRRAAPGSRRPAGPGPGLVLVLLVAGCDRDQAPPPPEDPRRPVIQLASFDFPESEILGELYGQALRQHGFPVEQVVQLGAREVVGARPRAGQGRHGARVPGVGAQLPQRPRPGGHRRPGPDPRPARAGLRPPGGERARLRPGPGPQRLRGHRRPGPPPRPGEAQRPGPAGLPAVLRRAARVPPAAALPQGPPGPLQAAVRALRGDAVAGGHGGGAGHRRDRRRHDRHHRPQPGQAPTWSSSRTTGASSRPTTWSRSCAARSWTPTARRWCGSATRSAPSSPPPS